MYTIKAFTADGGEYWIHNPKVRTLVTGTPYFEIGDNINGSAEFTIYPDHPYYSKVEKLTTDITIYKDGEEVFNGRVLYDDEDFNGAKKVYVEGELGYLCDSVQRPAVYHDISPEKYLETILDIHNSQVEERKHFYVGIVTVKDSNDSIYRYSNYETTRETITDKLINRLGGHLRIRKVDGVRYLDYLDDDDYYENATQTIEFGKNLLDYAKNVDATDLATCIIPLGAKQDDQVIEGLDAYLTIEDANGGVDYVTDDAAVAQYGKIYKIVNYDDVTVAANLLAKGKEYLESVQYENLVLELTAIDLNLTDDEIEAFTVGSRVRCISTPNNFDAWYPISKMKVYLMDFSKNTFTLGIESTNSTYTSSNQQTTSELTKTINSTPTKSEILAAALAEATELINATVASGYAIHEPNEFIVADDPDYKNQAKNLWRWGYGGLAHYSNGYYGEADGIAITMDGTINGKMLMANSVYAESIDVGYTEALETLIEEAEEDANDYTDSKAKEVTETINVTISNLNQQIALAVTDTKEAIVQKNYVTAGESEELDLDEWTMTGTVATAEIAEYQNVNCIKLTFTSAGIVYFTQSVGTLSAGDYTVQMQTAYDSDYTMPSYGRIGFSNSYGATYYSSSIGKDNFYTMKRTMTITAGSRSVYFGVYGKAGSVVYIKNIRCLRDYQELLDELESNLTVSIGEVSASVSELYESSLHDYCLNGDFSDEDSALASWYISSSSYVTSGTYSDVSCATIANPSSSRAYIRQSFTNPKEGKVTIRFKAACASGYESTARIRCYLGGTSKYTTAGQLSTAWTQFEFEYDSVAAGTIYLYLYNYVYSTTVYITDVEILGYTSYYAEAQITILSDTITSSIEKAIETATNYTDDELKSYALSANVTNEIEQAISDYDATLTTTLQSTYYLKSDAVTLETNLKTLITANTTSITSEISRAQTAESSLSAVDTKYGTCSTAASTVAKVVSCSDFKSSSLVKGATICVYFTYANTATAPTLNVNSTGAKTIYAYGASIASGSDYNWPAKSYVTFVYSGSVWVMSDSGASSKIVQTAESLTATMAETYYTQSAATTLKTTLEASITANTTSIASEVTRATAAETSLSAADTKYGTCSTAASTAAKVVTCSSFTSSSLAAGATICVYFTYANTASSPTLNVNSTGAKYIYAYGSLLTSTSEYNWPAKSYVTFVYNGTRWCMVDAGASSKIEQLADSISLSVTSGTGGTASITLSVDGETSGSGTVVSSARSAFAAESSSITISAGTITFSSNTLVVNSSQFTLTSSGNATFSGTLSAASGSFSGSVTSTSGYYKTIIGSGYIGCYYDDSLYGRLTAIYSSSTATYFSLLGDTTNCGAVSIGFGSTGYIFVNNTANPNGYDEKVQIAGTSRFTGTINCNAISASGSLTTSGVLNSTQTTSEAQCNVSNNYGSGRLAISTAGNFGVYDSNHSSWLIYSNSSGTHYIPAATHTSPTISGSMTFSNSAYITTLTYNSSAALCVRSGGFYVYGDLGCSGTKYRVVDTENYGKIGMNAFETASAHFADFGSGEIGTEGYVKINFDEVFAETIEIDSDYQVFTTRTSPGAIAYVNKEKKYFVVYGDTGTTFDWMICAYQKGYADKRLEPVEIVECEDGEEDEVNDGEEISAA